MTQRSIGFRASGGQRLGDLLKRLCDEHADLEVGGAVARHREQHVDAGAREADLRVKQDGVAQRLDNGHDNILAVLEVAQVLLRQVVGNCGNDGRLHGQRRVRRHSVEVRLHGADTRHLDDVGRIVRDGAQRRLHKVGGNG